MTKATINNKMNKIQEDDDVIDDLSPENFSDGLTEDCKLDSIKSVQPLRIPQMDKFKELPNQSKLQPPQSSLCNANIASKHKEAFKKE